MPPKTDPEGALRRVGVLGDVHCQFTRLERALAHFEQERVEAVLCVGDLIDGPGDANATLALLQRAQVSCVSGNHERWLLTDTMRDLPDATPNNALSPASVTYLRSLPKTRVIETVAGRLLLCHGLGENDFLGIRPDDRDEFVLDLPEVTSLDAAHYAFVLNGHTHRPMVRKVRSFTVLNAGTLLPGHRSVCSVLDFHARRMAVFDVSDQGVRAAAEWSLDANHALDTGR
ncbi:MAG TPA: metallophosphoesterase family protein [Polyangiaceae bacterium]|nr:metallophosphoesterase family protein [Polyangiaceae bacterium]